MFNLYFEGKMIESSKYMFSICTNGLWICFSQNKNLKAGVSSRWRVLLLPRVGPLNNI